jgi:preprotein translocase subunit SecD
MVENRWQAQHEIANHIVPIGLAVDEIVHAIEQIDEEKKSGTHTEAKAEKAHKSPTDIAAEQ